MDIGLYVAAVIGGLVFSYQKTSGASSSSQSASASSSSPKTASPPKAPAAAAAAATAAALTIVGTSGVFPETRISLHPVLLMAKKSDTVIENPQVSRSWPPGKNFVTEADYSMPTQQLNVQGAAAAASSDATVVAAASVAPPRPIVNCYNLAGPSASLYHKPSDIRVAIATCGGLCPGLNTVIRELVMAFTFTYGVPRGNVNGVLGGYEGFYNGVPYKPLTPEDVVNIHQLGGTILGSSREKPEPEKVIAALIQRGINAVILIGGDGTHRGADALHEAIVRQGARITVAAVPKTIDNDISLIDKSFGFETACAQAVPVIQCARTEATSAPRGIGLVKLMGRDAGFIAVNSTLAARCVNVCLIPEATWYLSSLLAHLEERLERPEAASRHAVIVIAEGARPEELKQEEAAAGKTIVSDIGDWLKGKVIAHFASKKKICNLKYIDPSYIIRSAPANAADSDLCASLAFNCAHGVMGGRTAFTVGTVDTVGCFFPIPEVAHGEPRRVNVNSRIWSRVLLSTGQPSLCP